MFKKSGQYALFMLIGLFIWQWFFRPVINWGDIIGISAASALLYLLFEWVDKREEENRDS